MSVCKRCCSRAAVPPCWLLTLAIWQWVSLRHMHAVSQSRPAAAGGDDGAPRLRLRKLWSPGRVSVALAAAAAAAVPQPTPPQAAALLLISSSSIPRSAGRAATSREEGVGCTPTARGNFERKRARVRQNTQPFRHATMAEVGRRSGGYEPARYGSPSAAARRQARLAASGSPRSPSAAARTQLQGSSPSTSTTSWASPASSPRRTARSPSRRAAGNRSSPQRTAHLTTIPRLQLAESGGVGGQGENALGETLSLMQRLGGPGADTLTDAELRSSLDARPKLQLRPLRSMQHFLEFEQAVARVASLNQQEQDEASAARETALTQVKRREGGSICMGGGGFIDLPGRVHWGRSDSPTRSQHPPAVLLEQG